MARLTSDQWNSIKTVWEYSPDEPTYSDSAQKACEKHGFMVPSRQSIAKKAKTDHWQRKASLAGINQATHRMADKMVDSDAPHRSEWQQYPPHLLNFNISESN